VNEKVKRWRRTETQPEYGAKRERWTDKPGNAAEKDVNGGTGKA